MSFNINDNKKLNYISFINNKNNNLFDIKRTNSNFLLFLIKYNSIIKGFTLILIVQILIFIYFIRYEKIILEKKKVKKI